jgi:hypothetical protein
VALHGDLAVAVRRGGGIFSVQTKAVVTGILTQAWREMTPNELAAMSSSHRVVLLWWQRAKWVP